MKKCVYCTFASLDAIYVFYLLFACKIKIVKCSIPSCGGLQAYDTKASLCDGVITVDRQQIMGGQLNNATYKVS